MCQFKSGIILKNNVVIAEGHDDSHSNLLKEMGIEDDYLNASKTFIRAELVPKDGEWWVNPSENPGSWDFIVDQDIVPEWFDKEHYESIFREAVCAWWKVHVLVDQKVDQLSEGYYRLKRSTVTQLCNDVKILCNSSTVQKMYDSSTVQKMYGSSIVQKMYDSSIVQKMYGSSTVQEMCNSSTVQKMYDSSIVQKMYGSSTVQEMCGSSTVQEICNSSTVQEMYDSSTVQEMYGSSTVQKMYDSSIVQKMYDSSAARDFKNYPAIKIFVPDNPGKFKMIAVGKERNVENL